MDKYSAVVIWIADKISHPYPYSLTPRITYYTHTVTHRYDTCGYVPALASRVVTKINGIFCH